MSTYLCTGYEAYVQEVDEALTTKFHQWVVLYLKSTANTQLTYDIGSYVAGSLGTFWTAAAADTTAVPVNVAQGILVATTAGAVATAALGVLSNVAGVLAESVIGVRGPALLPFGQVASGASTSQYVLSIVNNCPSIVWGTASAPTTTSAYFFEWDLSPGNHGVKVPLTYF